MTEEAIAGGKMICTHVGESLKDVCVTDKAAGVDKSGRVTMLLRSTYKAEKAAGGGADDGAKTDEQSDSEGEEEGEGEEGTDTDDTEEEEEEEEKEEAAVPASASSESAVARTTIYDGKTDGEFHYYSDGGSLYVYDHEEEEYLLHQGDEEPEESAGPPTGKNTDRAK
jgi:hypothetical protein